MLKLFSTEVARLNTRDRPSPWQRVAIWLRCLETDIVCWALQPINLCYVSDASAYLPVSPFMPEHTLWETADGVPVWHKAD